MFLRAAAHRFDADNKLCTAHAQLSLPEVNGTVRVAAPHKAWYKKMWSYAGLGFIISVGYSVPCRLLQNSV